MARLRVPLATAVVLGVTVAHAVVLPVLFTALMSVVTHSHTQMFDDYARGVARQLADSLELSGAIDDTERLRELLDGAMLSGQVAYAEVVDDGRNVRSSLIRDGLRFPAAADVVFGGGGDDVYFLALPIPHNPSIAVLRIGFDERTTRAEIADARQRIVRALLAYGAVALALSLVLSRLLARPVRELGQAATAVAGPGLQTPIRTGSRVRELAELAEALEGTRAELAATYSRLQHEIAALSSVEARHDALDDVLRRRQRLEAIGTLASGVAHEINNALVPITLFTESALDEVPSASAAHGDLTRVLAAARRAREIVVKVLTFSSSLSARRRQPVDLGGVVDEVATLFEHLGAANVRVERSLEPVPPSLGDRSLAVQLVTNLAHNACQAMPNGGVLSFCVRHVAASGGLAEQVEITVADTGIGMDETTRARMFEPFFTTRPVGEGTGLGLAVVHGIATGFGGQIDVDSAPGRGTRFRIRFPAVAAEPPASLANETDKSRETA